MERNMEDEMEPSLYRAWYRDCKVVYLIGIGFDVALYYM